MRFRLRRDRDADPAADAAIVTYSRLPPRSDRWADPDRREPVLEAEEVPLARGDFRVDRSHRAVPAFDNDDTPERPRRRRTGRGVAILGALAFAVGVMILAYAYGLATRLDGPAAPASASLGTPVTPDATLTSGSAVVDTGDGVRRISPDSGSPAAAGRRGDHDRRVAAVGGCRAAIVGIAAGAARASRAGNRAGQRAPAVQ